MVYLNKRALSGLKSYKYKPGGYTPMDDWHQPFWNFMAEKVLPDWLAPNLITLTGLSALIIAYILGAAELPDFDEPIPRKIYLIYGTAVLFYLHMDALDGKQARRTKTSSPLGQLFDHGCDALAVHLIISTLTTALQVRHGWVASCSYLYVYIPWVMAHWEEYHTGMMVYGNGIWGVTEANYSVVFLQYFTYIVGGGIWTSTHLAPVAAMLAKTGVVPPVVIDFLTNLRGNEMVLLGFGCLGVGMLFEQLVRVFRLAGTKHLEKTSLPKAEQGNKSLGRQAAVSHFLQLLAMFVLGGVFILPPSQVTGEVRVRLAAFGVIYALQATRLIVAHMAKEPFVIAGWALYLMAAQILNRYLLVVDPVQFTYGITAVVLVGYLHYIVSIIQEICEFLGIYALTIKKKAN